MLQRFFHSNKLKLKLKTSNKLRKKSRFIAITIGKNKSQEVLNTYTGSKEITNRRDWISSKSQSYPYNKYSKCTKLGETKDLR